LLPWVLLRVLARVLLARVLRLPCVLLARVLRLPLILRLPRVLLLARVLLALVLLLPRVLLLARVLLLPLGSRRLTRREFFFNLRVDDGLGRALRLVFRAEDIDEEMRIYMRI